MKNSYLDFQAKFRLAELIITETEHWIWSIRPSQVTVGAGILSIKRAIESFSELTESESLDLGKIIKIIERTSKETFVYNRINYLMLMMVDFQVHFHVIPRYNHEINFLGMTWKDKGWPAQPFLDAEVVSDDILFAIRDNLKQNL